jgi:beta-N-acetylhexosaminidase
MNKLRTEDLGELFFIQLGGDRWSASLEKRLRSLRPGGIVLTARNWRAADSAAEFLGRIARALDFHPFLAIEEEGGVADPLQKLFPPLPSPQTVGRRGPEAARKLGQLAGAGMKLLGLNINLAPRLDLANATEKDLQTFGSGHQVVTQCGTAFVKGLKHHGVLACGKYFPGIGDARPDSDTGLTLSSKPMARMWREDLAPYLKLLGQLPMVMVSHRAYKAYDFDRALPAPLSRNVLEGLLRVKLGYCGVALVDPQGELQERLSLDAEAVTKSIAAGSDMAVVRDSDKTFEPIAESVRNALEVGTISAQRIGEALKRIHRARKKIHPRVGKFSRNAYARLCREFEDFSKEF